MEMIDVSYTVKPDAQGRRLMLDIDTGERTWVDPRELDTPVVFDSIVEGAVEAYLAAKQVVDPAPEPKPAKKKRLFHG